ncbi:acetyltransferase [Coxiella burnetii]|uniref:Acetyltransferase family protein n=1 Tax=Coxiella burnetii (strain RSA 493 / Nine Mile phase I) TaxID=227377 RepID=Q83EC3_COXBU|nr:acetyltransferase [Coxiella burnetii]NP_819441.1 acetyltransferase family protein [Coxiella burnetii RSA 493]ACJ20807.1 acetyltransferase family protein [Coxiella burnetii CbuK_Q154]APQ67098.1 acetyltransferase [Coxiella burnetii 'MSU Goat Q177']ATN86389.1 acetyltransferase [Coxiella burnetii str. Schperling]AAO89955.1 acetyltransferase family protein [Coxiella burnetii RSA 493]AML48724.1 acetyltransferase [Coxiella burnetii]
MRNLDLFCKGINNNGNYTFYHWIAFDKIKPHSHLL